jgi:hypothetical protein
MTAAVHRLLVLDDQPEAAAVRAFVASGAWRDVAAFQLIATRNPRYEAYAFPLPDVGTPCILKIAQAAPKAHRLARRLEALVSHLARDPSRRALRGARLLAQNGLPTLRPLACWTARRGGFFRDSFFLYTRIPARHSLKDYKLGTTGLPPAENARALDAFVAPLAELVAELHRRGLRHDDLACGNFLVGADGALYLVDVDHVHAARLRRWPRLKRCFDLNDLRRLDLDGARLDVFLRRYLGADDSPGWRRAFAFWRAGGNRPFRWLRRRLGLRRGSDR